MAEVVSIKKYIGFEKGKAPKETFDFPADGLVPYLSPEYLRGTGNPLYVKPSNKLASIDDGELIILWDGSNAGEVFISKKGVLGSTMTKIVFDENEFDKSYFSYALKYNEYFLKAKTAGSGIPHVDKGIVKKIEVFKPEPAEQRTIASILSKVDEAIAATKNSIAKAERLKKALMQNLLTGKLKPQGTWRNEEAFYKDEKFGNVPIGWGLEPLGKWFDFFPTSSYPRATLLEQGECKYIHYGDIHTKYHGFLNISEAPLPFITKDMEKKYTKVIDGDLILADASEDYDGVGKAIEIINTGENKAIAGLHTLHLRGKDNYFVNGYKGYLLNHWKVRNSILRTSAGIKVYSISKGTLSKILLPIPSPEEQKLIASILSAVDMKIESKQTKVKKLERLKKALMQNLLTGKVRVKIQKLQAQ